MRNTRWNSDTLCLPEDQRATEREKKREEVEEKEGLTRDGGKHPSSLSFDCQIVLTPRGDHWASEKVSNWAVLKLSFLNE